jgi:predicted  nucleic acid-binding Zn-ribbon protein
MKISVLENKLNSIEAEFRSKTNDTEIIAASYEDRFKKLKDELSVKNAQLADLSDNHKVLQEYVKNNEKTTNDLKEQISHYKTLIDNKDQYYADKLNRCSNSLINASEDKKKITHEESHEKNELERVI